MFNKTHTLVCRIMETSDNSRVFYKSRQMLTKNLRFGGKMESKCKILFSGSPKGMSLSETTSFDVLIVKIGAGVLTGCRQKEEPKN